MRPPKLLPRSGGLSQILRLKSMLKHSDTKIQKKLEQVTSMLQMAGLH